MHNLQHGSSTIMQEVLANGNIPVAGRGRNGMLAGAGGVIPPVLLDENRVPRFYHEAIVACGATNNNMLPHTALVYNMMVTSGLPRHILSYIWSAVNRTLPGQLTRAEFYSCLALIALAQKGESIAALSNSSQLPIPHLQTVQVPVQQNPPMILVTGQQQPTSRSTSQPQKTTASRFIPTSLLSRLRAPSESKKEADLIGEFASSSSSVLRTLKEEMTPPAETGKSELSVSGPNYDLSDVDWNNVGGSFGDSGNSTILSDVKTSPASSQCSMKNKLVNWEETVHAANKLFKDCENALGKSPKEVLTEVFETEKGTIYLRSLHTVSTIISRIAKTSAGTLPKELREELDFCNKVWNNYSNFLRPDETKEEGNSTIGPTPCPICQDIVTQTSVEFRTRAAPYYHPSCANLWLNCIGPDLP